MTLNTRLDRHLLAVGRFICKERERERESERCQETDRVQTIFSSRVPSPSYVPSQTLSISTRFYLTQCINQKRLENYIPLKIYILVSLVMVHNKVTVL